MPWLLPLYVATAVFGVGITLADLLGAFSHLTHDGGGHDGGGHDAGGHGFGTHDLAGHDAAQAAAHDIGTHDTGGHEAVHDVAHDGSHDGSAHHDGESAGSTVAQDARMRGSGLMTAMGVARSVVYFCLGFGPVGLFALTQYKSSATTLLWSIPVGAVVMVGTRLLRRVASREISSDITAEDLLMERGVVTVTIGRGEMGKVRVTVGGSYADWYARSKGDTPLKEGTRIRVVDVTDECVYVEEE